MKEILGFVLVYAIVIGGALEILAVAGVVFRIIASPNLAVGSSGGVSTAYCRAGVSIDTVSW